MEIKSDQQIRTESYTFPPDEHQRVVVRQDQRQHGEHEQVHVSKEAVIAAFVRHVSSGINMDQQPHASNKQQPNGGEWVEQETEIGAEGGRSSFRFQECEMG